MQRETPYKQLFWIFAVSAVGAVLALTPLVIQAQGRGGPKPPPPAQLHVTTTVYDRDASSGALLLFRSDDYNGVDQATYENTVDANTGWGGIFLANQSLRWVWVSLSQPVPGSPLNPAPDGFYWDKVEVYSRCWDASNQEVQIQLIPAATSMNRCSFGLDFAYNKIKYKLVMGPSIPSLVLDTVGTGWATVSCNAASGTTCTDWSIVPNMIAGNGNVPTVANLYVFTRNGTSLVGQYYNTYRIHAVSHP